MPVVIVSIGDELVTGQTVDTNTAWLAQRVRSAGGEVRSHLTVGDDLDQIADAIQLAWSRAPGVVMTGGLGPTPDDLTRAAVARVLGVEMVEDAEAVAHIEAMFARWQRVMPLTNRVQALVPAGCSAIANPCGTAPGLWYQHGERWLAALPGVPREMRAMFEASVQPHVEAMAKGRVCRSVCVRTFGWPESKIAEALGEMMARDRQPRVGTTAAGAQIGVRILAVGGDAEEAEAALAGDVAEVQCRLGEIIYGQDDETLATAVAKLLLRADGSARATVATAESCTGGLVAKRLTDVPGSSAYFLRGYVTYANAAKIEQLGVPAEVIDAHGAVSEPVARAMAEGCRRMAGTDYALASTGIAGPGGGTADKPVGLVYIALAGAGGTQARRLLLGEHLTRGEVRDRAAKCALDLLRLELRCRAAEPGWSAGH